MQAFDSAIERSRPLLSQRLSEFRRINLVPPFAPRLNLCRRASAAGVFPFIALSVGVQFDF